MSFKKILRIHEVMNKTGLSKTTAYRLARNPSSGFPASVKLTEKTIGWYEHEIDAWIESRRTA
ncbi:AlpA family phage regulatory protein [Thiothrix lacustris]|uniref:AlpA family phage regulatory protein n=1 Tax=Thiothrix lacustris TaxID=525917 RepID=A0ABY9MPH3_9GAMM|nr:AlpA family phage regulatory protein [Thiothrix lacustris]WML90141.1 AlpA family phage regulatory protein [Thiothrix lacustris]